MRPYGIKRKDIARDCTGTNKYGGCKINSKCSCGKTKSRRTSKIKASSRERKNNLELYLGNYQKNIHKKY